MSVSPDAFMITSIPELGSSGKTADVDLGIKGRVRGFEPAEFWQESLGRQSWREMIDKYEALASAAILAEGPRAQRYREALTELSSRWPGSLREGELVGPVRVEARRQAAEAGHAAPERPRAEWSDEHARAVVLWAALHGLIRDQLEFRASKPEERTSAAFASWVAGRSGSGGLARWPGSERIPAIMGPKLRVRGAYLWLAARAGISLPTLNGLLFARAGHWDHRADDPQWALG